MTALPLATSLNYLGPMRRRNGVVLGVGVSLLLHAALLYGWRHALPPALPDTGPRVESLTVWIRPPAIKPPPPPPVASVQPRREPKLVQTPPAPRATRSPASTSISETAPPAITMQAPAAPGDTTEPSTTPKFDMEAARSTARKMASERDPAKVGTAVGQIPDKPLQTETQLARNIAQGKRGDCRTAYAGAGLLAPVLMLLDKKDSGCKW